MLPSGIPNLVGNYPKSLKFFFMGFWKRTVWFNFLENNLCFFIIGNTTHLGCLVCHLSAMLLFYQFVKKKKKSLFFFFFEVSLFQCVFVMFDLRLDMRECIFLTPHLIYVSLS